MAQERPKRYLRQRKLIPIWLTCAIFFLFQPRFLYSGTTASFMEIGAIAIMIACAAIYIKCIRIDLIGVFAFAYLAAMTLSCIINYGNPYFTLVTYGPLSASLLLARATIPGYKKELLWSIVAVTGTYTFLNLAVLCLIPVGDIPLHPDDSNTFLSYRNSFCGFYFPAIGASLLLDQESGKPCSPLSLALFASALAQSAISYSATSVFALAVFFVGICLITSRRIRRYLNACTFVGAYLVLFVGIVLLRFQNLFSLTVESLGRDITFTGRTAIWDLAISLIDQDHLLLGYNGVTERILTLPTGGSVGTAHNALLDVMLWGGLVALCLVGAIVLLASINLFKQRVDRSAAILSIYIGVFLLMGIVEFLTCTAFFLFLGIASSWTQSDQKAGGRHACSKTCLHAKRS